MRIAPGVRVQPLLFVALLSVGFPLLATPPASAQSPASPPKPAQRPVPPQPPAVDQEQFISYWTTETGWRTELQLRNNQVGQVLTVTPVLRTMDGIETPLPPVTIQSQEVKTVDIATAIGTSEPQLIGTYGSLVLRYRTPGQAALYAAAMIMGVGHSIAFHIDATGEDQAEDIGSREGIWWMPNGTADDYFIIANQGQQPLPLALSLYDAHGKASVQNLTLPARGMSRVSVRRLIATTGLAGSYGGIKVSALSHAGSLDTLHVLFDEKAGFSAVMKMFDYDPRAQIKERDHAGTGHWTLRAPMLALSSPDPALAFPVGTVLQPQIFIRNTTAKPIEASLTFNWRSVAASGKVSGPALHLNPYETRRIDVAALQNGQTLPRNAQWASVTLVTNGLPDEIVAVTASYDSTLRYGAQTPFSDQLAAHWAGGQWAYDPQHDSIITTGNGGAKPTLAAFTIFYNQGTQKYQLEQILQPGEQMWMDIGKLIRESVPDKTGKALPRDLTTGSYEVRDLTNKGTGSLFEGKVIWDRTYGHVTYGCAGCCGYINPATPWYNPVPVIINGFQDDGVDAYNTCDSATEDVSDSFWNHWSSGNTAIASVDYYGRHKGLSAGSTTSQTSGQLSMARPRACILETKAPSGGVNVVSAVISQRTSGQVSSDDSALSNYQTAVGTTNLGNFTNISAFHGCGIGIETIGVINPSNYTGNVTIHRTIVNQGFYTNSTDSGGEKTNYDDTSPSQYRDDDPQSGGSAGKVYDLDAPGAHPPGIDGNIYRYRTNFSAYATLPNGAVVSPSYGYFFYVRLSCQQVGAGYVFVNDVPGDNQIGSGTTKTTWNLQ
jgi:hypothetical protein